VWVATYQERVRHAHLAGLRVCSSTLVMDTAHWLVVKVQPKHQCVACLLRLREALR
jgi:hypothetical protein